MKRIYFRLLSIVLRLRDCIYERLIDWDSVPEQLLNDYYEGCISAYDVWKEQAFA